MPITTSGTSITFNDSTVQTTAFTGGGVTSVATGNGLQGGTITTTGTLSVACPTVNTVGSYAFLYATNGDVTEGGTKAGNIYFAGLRYNSCSSFNWTTSGAASGTWRCMGVSYTINATNTAGTVWCRVA